jgi:hypothetical protein
MSSWANHFSSLGLFLHLCPSFSSLWIIGGLSEIIAIKHLELCQAQQMAATAITFCNGCEMEHVSSADCHKTQHYPQGLLLVQSLQTASHSPLMGIQENTRSWVASLWQKYKKLP